MTRPSIEERMDMWLNWQADLDGIPDEDRQWYIDAMRGTTRAACAEVSLAADDVADAIAETGLGRLLLWASGYRNRVPRWVRHINQHEGEKR